MSLSVTLDATPLLGRRTGIGRYTECLLDELARRPELDLRATAFTLRGSGNLADALPAGVRARSLPLPARVLRAAWLRTEQPKVGLLAGRSRVFHGTNFVLPPPGRAAGVVTVHDLAFLTMPELVDRTSRALGDLLPRSLRRAAMVLTPSAAVADQVRNAYPVPADRVRVTPLGVAPEWFTAAVPGAELRIELGLPPRYLLFVGTREPRKDLATLVRAHRMARAADPDTPDLVLVGPSGWGEEATLPGVKILGYLDQQVLPRVVAGAAAVIMPSRYEGFGIPVLEGLAAGVRVLTSDDPAMREVGGPHTEVFGIGDAEALAALLSRPEPDAGAAARRADGRVWAAAWTWERCADRTVAAYRDAAA